MVGNGSSAERHSTTSGSGVSQRTVTLIDACGLCFVSLSRNLFDFLVGVGGDLKFF